MERAEKISKIEEMLFANIPSINNIKIRPEHESLLFCLFIGDKIIGVDIQKSFIGSKTIQEIEVHFSERNIYRSILSGQACDHEGVFIHGNDPICREMFL